MSFDHQKIEDKWRKKWQESGLYQLDLKKAKNPFYNLMMFPYPSAEGLHVGNMYAFTGADIYGRFQAMQGKSVFEPIGLDGFGIHSENYAIKIKKHPKKQAKISEKRFYEQLQRIGNQFNWDYRLETYDPDYYKWTQWLFIKMFENDLAYRKKSLVNWCPSCKTVLSDEQVEGGVCERCKSETQKKETYQWFFKITKYAQKLLDNLDKIDWPEKIKTAQREWIGRKEGVVIGFKLLGSERSRGLEPLTITCFTTRPDTLHGTSFLVIAPEYAQKLIGLISSEKKEKVKQYIKKALKKTEQKRRAEEKQKTGVDTGLKAVNPINQKEIPVWVADYVLMDYGSGAVMGVPGHDQRDWDFAKKHDLEIIEVIKGGEIKNQAYDGSGKIVNSGEWNGLKMPQQMNKVIEDLVKRGIGKKEVQFKLRDWCISRQRYWGPPIPMIYCLNCAKSHSRSVMKDAGWYPEKKANLPIKLPNIQDFKPTGDGKSPLEKAPKEWLYTKCPKCGNKAKRETDVSDTFLDSSWYFLRYPNLSHSRSVMRKDDIPFRNKMLKKWLPVNAYIGGAEHAVLHLMYSRFVWMALQDFDILPKTLGPEPFPFLYGHGLIIKDGAKMSKSRGNIVNPDEYMDKFGVDALRMYLMFIGPFDQGGDFRDTGMGGMSRFLGRVWDLVQKFQQGPASDVTSENGPLRRLEHQTIKRVTKAVKSFKYNVAIAVLMEYVNELSKTGADLKACQSLVLLLAPMAPYLTEELWVKLGGKYSVHQQKWPKYDEQKAKEKKLTVVVQVNGKLRSKLKLKREEAGHKQKVIKKAMADKKIQKWLKDKKIVKEIFVPQRLVNLVIK